MAALIEALQLDVYTSDERNRCDREHARAEDGSVMGVPFSQNGRAIATETPTGPVSASAIQSQFISETGISASSLVVAKWASVCDPP